MGKRLPEIAANDIVTLDQGKSEVGALALITLSPEKYAAEVYQPFKARLTAAIEGVKAIDYDIKTTAGMATAVTARATFRDLRVEAEKERKSRKAPILSIGNLLESGYNNLEARITPLEELFDGDIQAETKRKAEVKAEEDRLKAARAAAIRAKIAEISGLPAKHVRATAAQLTDALRELATREIMKEEFAEQTDDARAAVDTAAAELIALRDAATESEAVALAAEEARKAEAQRAAEEAAAVAAQRAENERVANEQAAERQRLANLAAAQEAEARRVREQAAANLKADRDAQELAMRLEREKAAREQAERDQAAAEQQRQLAAQQAEFEAKRAAFAREQEEAAARVEAAVRLAADHVDALIDNAQFDADREAQREQEHHDSIARLQSLADQHLADKRDLPRPESASLHDEMVDAGMGIAELSDEDIIEFGKEWELGLVELVECLEAFTVRARAGLLVAA